MGYFVVVFAGIHRSHRLLFSPVLFAADSYYDFFMKPTPTQAHSATTQSRRAKEMRATVGMEMLDKASANGVYFVCGIVNERRFIDTEIKVEREYQTKEEKA